MRIWVVEEMQTAHFCLDFNEKILVVVTMMLLLQPVVLVILVMT